MLEKTLESPLDCKEIKSLNPKGNHLWIFIGRTDVETEASILWPSDTKSRLFGKTLMMGKTEGMRRRGQQTMRLAWWHHQLNEHEFEQTPEIVKQAQGSLACCSPWGLKSRTQLSKWTAKLSKFLQKETRHINSQSFSSSRVERD